MVTLKNTSKGVRTVQIKDGKKVSTAYIEPGATLEGVELVNENDKVLVGMIEVGDLEISDAKKKAPAKDEAKDEKK